MGNDTREFIWQDGPSTAGAAATSVQHVNHKGVDIWLGRGFSHQLLQVVLDRVRVHHDADGHQRVERKIEYLVAEERDDPSGAQLKRR